MADKKCLKRELQGLGIEKDGISVQRLHSWKTREKSNSYI